MPADAVILKRQIFILKQVKCVAFYDYNKNTFDLVKYTKVVILNEKFYYLILWNMRKRVLNRIRYPSKPFCKLIILPEQYTFKSENQKFWLFIFQLEEHVI